MKSFVDSNRDALGPSAEEIIAINNRKAREENQTLREKEKEKEKEDEKLDKTIKYHQKLLKETKELNDKAQKIQERLKTRQEEHGSIDEANEETNRLETLLKNTKENYKSKQKELAGYDKIMKQQKKVQATLQRDIGKIRKERATSVAKRNETEAGLNRTKSLDELEERYETLKRENEEDQRVMDDENATSSEKKAAEARIEERREEIERLAPQIQQREEALPLRGRVKNIFDKLREKLRENTTTLKKLGYVVQAIVLAAGLVLGALALTGLKGLKAGTQAVGKGLENIGQKLGSLLPGLIGSIVSFISKAAGQVLSFLGEHAWLLILAVVAFLMERRLTLTWCESTGSVFDCVCVCVDVSVGCVCVFGFVCLGASPWASVACLCIGFAGWLFGGLTLLGPPAISFSEAFLLVN